MQPPAIERDPLVQVLEWACIAILVTLVILICGDVLSRSFLHHSWGGTDELGGFMLVAVTYLGLAVSLAKGGFHQIEVVSSRLSKRRASMLNLAMGVVSLVFALILSWQFIRLSLRSFSSGEISNAMMVPLWIPRLSMLVGSIGLIWVLMRLIVSEFRSLVAAPEKV